MLNNLLERQLMILLEDANFVKRSRDKTQQTSGSTVQYSVKHRSDHFSMDAAKFCNSE